MAKLMNIVFIVLLTLWILDKLFWLKEMMWSGWLLLDIIYVFWIIAWFVTLVKWWSFLVDGSSSVATKYKIPPIVIWLTILSFWTSAPEFFVNVIAAAKGETDIMISNIIWSNIANLLLILWTASLIIPLTVNNNTVFKEIPFSLLAVIVLFVLLNDTFFVTWADFWFLSRWDWIILLLFFVIFMYYVFSLAQKWDIDWVDDLEAKLLPTSLIMIVLWLLWLYIWWELIIDNSSILAWRLWASDILIWATIVAIWTSLPELVASVMAALKNQAQMAVWNVIWSNIFNIFWITWVWALITDVNFDPKLNIDMILLTLSTFLVLFFVYSRKDRKISRNEWIFMLIMYVFYIGFLIYRW